MKKQTRDVLIFGILLLVSSLAARGQSYGPFRITGTGCTTPIDVSQKATVTFQVTGATWTGTIQPQVNIAGQAPQNTQVAPVLTGTSQSTIIANGAYFLNVSGFGTFLLCGNTVTNTATIYLNVASAPR